jgi:hypothetical protein
MDARRLLLILTNSYDFSVGHIIRRIGTDRVFRFNSDIWQDYQIDVGVGDFRIVNPTGFSISRADVAKAYWRHPVSRFDLPGHRPQEARFYKRWLKRISGGDICPQKMSAQERFIESEIGHLVGEVRNLLWKDRKLVLVEPASRSRLGKLLEMEIASRYFQVPDYRVVYRANGFGNVSRQRVAKSLSAERLGANTFFWTTKVDESRLDKSMPWFVQDLVEAEHDVTVVHIRGRNFAFSLERVPFVHKSVDWRTVGDDVVPLWKPEALNEDHQGRINRFMDEVGLRYGRLDFLRKDGAYWFLEVNSNGEWGWLDPKGENGVLDALVAELHPDMPVYPIRNWGEQAAPQMDSTGFERRENRT